MPLFHLYHRLLFWCLRRPLAFLTILMLLLGTSVVYLWQMPHEILPEVASEDIELQLSLPPGALPGARLLAGGQDVGWVTSAAETSRGRLGLGHRSRRRCLHRGIRLANGIYHFGRIHRYH